MNLALRAQSILWKDTRSESVLSGLVWGLGMMLCDDTVKGLFSVQIWGSEVSLCADVGIWEDGAL